jgi:NAD(P)-dependent dehydrogenase (short-subunit alcohol dehydrogenase family)
MTGRLAGRKIVITGAGSGIGRAAAQVFTREGAKLALLDRDEAAAKATAAETGGTVIKVDVSDAADVEGALKAANEALGGIDGLLNSAGILSSKSFGAIEPEHWRKVIDVNLTGTFLVCQAALPYLKEQPNAAIVNIASGQALLPSLTGSAYAASKAGVMMFTKCLAMELAPGIRANAICPGATATPMTDNEIPPEDIVRRQKLESAYAMKRLCVPEDIANGILYLMSNEASAVTGIALAVDNGRTFH